MSQAARTKRHICAVMVDRANYGRMKPVLLEILERDELMLSTVCAGTMVLSRFDEAYKVVEGDGIPVTEKVYMELEGSTPHTMSKSIGLAILEFSNVFRRMKPDILLMIGDRYEALGAVIAAAYMNIPIVHIQGGEVSGSIDESARHAISKFAQFHCPSTRRAADYLVRMGERPDTILAVGCPSSDLAKTFTREAGVELLNGRGSGQTIDPSQPFALCVFHPTTTDLIDVEDQMLNVLSALGESGLQVLMLWPNIDAGSDRISKAIRTYRAAKPTDDWLRIVTNFEPDDYLAILKDASVLIGNSSSFVRDAGYFGTPTVLVGERQASREMDEHVTHVSPVERDVSDAIRNQLSHGRYAPSTLYGDGDVSRRIVDKLVSIELYIQKTLHYVFE